MIAPASNDDTPRAPRLGAAAVRLGVAAACAVVAIFLALNGRDASKIRTANEHGAAGRFDEAIATSEEVRRAPADARALVVRARALTAARRLAEADAAWAAVARRDPNNWQWQLAWARVQAARGDGRGALRRLRRARELNPRLRLPALGR